MDAVAQSQRLFLTRLAIGLVQGLALYLLYHAQETKVWPATTGTVFGPLLLTGLFIPLLLNQALGEMALRRAAAWALIAAAILAALGVYDLWSAWPVYKQGAPTIIPSARLFLFCAAGLFMAHALVVGAAIDHRFRASYTTHFDTAWKLAVQLALAILFVGIFWLLLWLGASLFALIKLDFFRRLLGHEWFSIPVIAMAAAGALHLTDIRPVLVRGARTLLLNLLSWLLPLLTLIVAGFLASLPFTGLAPLWAVGHASALLLAAAAVLVLLINAAHQDGDEAPAKVLRWSGTLAALLPLPLGAIAIYALYLRVSQYGWTEDRVLVAAALTVAGFHALGYARAALSRGPWLQRIENWNFLAALLTLAMLMLLSTPVADPRRIAVNDQMAQLAAGKIAPAKFDLSYLRREGGRYGLEALRRLSVSGDPALRLRAADAMQTQPDFGGAARPAAIAARITVWPHGQKLPAGFLAADWSKVQSWVRPACMNRDDASGCDAILADLDGDGKPEVMVFSPGEMAIHVFRDTGMGWEMAGQMRLPDKCPSVLSDLRDGKFELVPPRPDWKQLRVGTAQLALNRPYAIDTPPPCPH